MSAPPWQTEPFAGWPPLAGDAPPAALTAHAGDDASGFVGSPRTLGGSATGGVGPYTYLWSVQSAPAGGVAMFVDATSPTTDVTFTVSTGVYVLKLRVTDSTGHHAADLVSETALPLPLLDTLSVQPTWAHWVGGKLRVAYAGPLFRVQNDALAELDIGAGANGLYNAAQLATFCGAGDGHVVKVYNQALVAVPASLDPVGDVSGLPLVYRAGVPLLGATGFLAAHVFGGPDFDNVSGLEGTLLLAGDVAVTLVTDAAPLDATLLPYFAAGVQKTPSGNSDWFVDALWPDSDGAYIEVTIPNSTTHFASETPWPSDAGWVQYARSAGQQLQATSYQWKGATRAFNDVVGGTTVPVFVGDQLVWFGSQWAVQQVRSGNMLLWVGTKIGAPDLAQVNAFELAHHS